MTRIISSFHSAVGNILMEVDGEMITSLVFEKEKKVRKFTISGIYKTGLSDDFDNIFIFCDLRIIQKLNNWTNNMVAGFEIYTDDFQNLEKINAAVYNETGYLFNSKSIKETYPQIFNWLELQNINVAIIIALMARIAVCGIAPRRIEVTFRPV